MSGPSVRVLDAAGEEESRAVWEVYRQVFDDQSDHGRWRAEVWDRHRGRDGFRLACAEQDGRLVGFAYGYTGSHGQWWTDRVREVLDPAVAAQWLGGHFELVSIGVVAAARGGGVGRALLGAVTDGLPHDRLLLMATADAEDPARRLYAADGWSVLGPGVGPGTVVLGRRPSACSAARVRSGRGAARRR